MTPGSLTESEMHLILTALSHHEEITGAVLFGSRAKGTALAASDIDIALEGIDDELRAAAIARELDDLPLPYRFDVQAFGAITYPPLREHIERVGVRIYEKP